MNKLIKSKKGFTLVELIATIVLVGVISFSAVIAAEQSLTWIEIREHRMVMDSVSEAIFVTLKDARSTRSAADITTYSSTAFSFTKANGDAVSYQFSNGALLRNGDPLIEDVSSCTFEYLDANATAVASANEIKMLRLTLTSAVSGIGTLRSAEVLENL